jgi:glycosyltransferase involved in cell wall biosynthesis
MKYVQINSASGAWANSVIFKKHRELIDDGNESWVFWARGDHEQDEHMQCIATPLEVYGDALLTRIDGRPGFHSKGITKRLLSKLDEIDPDVVHLHVLTGYYINVELLFEWLMSHSCKVKWTLHDCWDFTGHCIYFTYAQCNQWKSGCAISSSCPQQREYPESWFAGDATVRRNYEEKKRLFTALPPNRVQIITPSYWLAGLVKESFLGKYDVTVIHNTVDTDVFRPTPSDFRERYGLEGKTVVLGVASKWSERKGLADFVRLAHDLDANKYAVIVVGLSNSQIKQVKQQVQEIVALPRTSSGRELAEVYTASDVLFNPTKEENYPTVNLEAQACGTPVITYNTGGCGETLSLAPSLVVTGYESALDAIRNFSISQ